MSFNPRSTGLILIAVLAGGTLTPANAQTARQKRPRRAVSLINDAYEKIKRRRSELVESYTERLFGLAESCVEDGLTKSGHSLLETVEKLYAIPRNRRKTDKAGVAVPDGNRPAQRRVNLKRVKQKQLSPEEKKRREEVLGRVAKLRKELGRGGELRLAPGGSDDGSSERKSGPARKLERYVERAREKFVRDVVKLAKSCVKQNFPAHGYELLLWVLPFDPDNRNLRRALGQGEYRKDKESPVQWYTAYELRKARAGLQLHPDYGWVNSTQLKNLEKGYVWYDKARKWLPRDRVEVLRQKWENAWVHETEHFKINTNAPLRDAVLFGREIERFYRFFFRVFVDYYTHYRKPPDPRLVFEGGMKLGEKLELNYYRSRESYLDEVKNDPVLAKVPNIGLAPSSAGFYYPGNGMCYFYRTPSGPDLTVIYHEVTHQIFGETTPGRGPRPCLWMVEGLGVFMEDPVLRGDAGSERLLAGAEPPPGIDADSPRDINDFVKNFQTDATFHGAGRGSNYATSGAAVHFFLFYEGGIYRKGFLRFAKEAYRNNDKNSPTPISRLYEYLRVSEEQLQKDWVSFNKKPHLFDF